MALARDKNTLLLNEPSKFEQGTWANPENIVGTTDPLTEFTPTGDVGYFERGSTNFSISRSYARFEAGTPFELVRNDLTGKELMIEINMAQWNTDVLELTLNADTDTSGNYEIVWLGLDEPTPTRTGYLMTTQRVDSKPMYFAMWAGEATAEEVGYAPSGDGHTMNALRLNAFKHANFGTTDTDNQHAYGAIWTDVA